MRTNVYIDGFNLYYGALRNTRYKWLDLEALCQNLLPEAQIERIRYFTAPVSGRASDPRVGQRQQVYLRALDTLPTVQIHKGRFFAKKKKRPLVKSGKNVLIHDTEEKGSDVNLASYLLHDAHRGHFEQAAVISNDSDLKTPIQLVVNDLNINVGLLNPHKQQARDLQNVSTFWKPIRAGVLQASQFPDTLSDKIGRFSKPPEW